VAARRPIVFISQRVHTLIVHDTPEEPGALVTHISQDLDDWVYYTE